MHLFYFLVDVAVVYSHILSQESPDYFKMTLKEYVLHLAKELMSQQTSRKGKGRPSVDRLHLRDSAAITSWQRTLISRVPHLYH
jgi:hypothetical protein